MINICIYRKTKHRAMNYHLDNDLHKKKIVIASSDGSNI